MEGSIDSTNEIQPPVKTDPNSTTSLSATWFKGRKDKNEL